MKRGYGLTCDHVQESQQHHMVWNCSVGTAPLSSYFPTSPGHCSEPGGREGRRKGGMEGEREGGRKGGREGGREGRREGGKEGGREEREGEGGKEGGREEGRKEGREREGRREGGKEGGSLKSFSFHRQILLSCWEAKNIHVYTKILQGSIEGVICQK